MLDLFQPAPKVRLRPTLVVIRADVDPMRRAPAQVETKPKKRRRTPAQIRKASRERMAARRERERQERIAAGTYKSRQEQARIACAASAEARRLPPGIALERAKERMRVAQRRRRQSMKDRINAEKRARYAVRQSSVSQHLSGPVVDACAVAKCAYVNVPEFAR
jgi:hypothetical protein